MSCLFIVLKTLLLFLRVMIFLEQQKDMWIYLVVPSQTFQQKRKVVWLLLVLLLFLFPIDYLFWIVQAVIFQLGMMFLRFVMRKIFWLSKYGFFPKMALLSP